MAIRSARDGPLPAFQGKTVIVGAGAVGITLAIALARRGQPVTVLEGGAREPRADYQQANRGPLTAQPYDGLLQGRMKALGGTTRLWGGQLVPFERRDFECRDEQGELLWPVTFEELAPWIDHAFAMLGVSPEARDAERVWRRTTGRAAGLGDGLSVGLNIWLAQPDFARLFGSALESQPGIEVITDCTVSALRFAAGRATAALEVAMPDGTTQCIEPGRVILANGTIEIGGLLLRAAAADPACPFAGNKHLGRWYFDHLHGLVGDIEIGEASALAATFDNVYFEGRKYSAKIRAGAGADAGANAAGTLNPIMTVGQLAGEARGLAKRMLAGGGGVTASLGRAGTLARIMVPMAWRYLRHRRSTSLFDRGVKLGIELEQKPSPDCYLVLDPADPPATARVGVHWSVDPGLAADLAQACNRIARAFEAQGFGRVTLDPRVARGDPAALEAFHDAYHHMGGARMATSAKRGVVDVDLKVFGTDNLYVVGAAVFPSGSFANPTLTAIALGQRLAAHLTADRTADPAQAKLAGRLVFGCSRLAGGASARSSARLLEAALDAGVATIDCAPSYGLSLAEQVVGRVLRRRRAQPVTVIAKLGSRRDRLGWAKSWPREAKRLLRGRTPRSFLDATPVAPVARYGRGDFSPAGLRASFDVARRRLGRIDVLLLHDCGPDEFTPETAAVLAELAASAGARLGYANSAMFDPATDRAFPPGGVAECAIDPRWLTGAAAPPERDGLVLHSIVPTGDWLARTDPAFAAALETAAAAVPAGDPATARMAALYALAAMRVPSAKLVFASTDPTRLGALLAAFEAIDAGNLAPGLAACFDSAGGAPARPYTSM